MYMQPIATAKQYNMTTLHRMKQQRRRRMTMQRPETCEVCLLQPRSAVALVPCGACTDAAAALDSGCPLCRCPIGIVLRLYN